MELKRATVYRALFSKRQLFEVMVEFWNNHFSMYHFKDDVSVLKTVDDRAVSRALRLRPLPRPPRRLGAQPGDDDLPRQRQQRRRRPQRELRPRADGAAHDRRRRRLHPDRRPRGRPLLHRLDGRLQRPGDGRRLPVRPRLPRSGAEDGARASPSPAAIPGASTAGGCWRSSPATPPAPPSSATKLCRHFVADMPPASVVAKAAATFTATGGDLRAVLRTILLSDEFFASAGQKLRRPYEFLVAALRAARRRSRPLDGIENLIWSLYPLGQVPFEWEPPNGYPGRRRRLGEHQRHAEPLERRLGPGAQLVRRRAGADPRHRRRRRGAKTSARFVDAMASRFLQRALDRARPRPADRLRGPGAGRQRARRRPGT